MLDAGLSEHFLDELFVVHGARLVLVGQCDHSVQLVLAEALSHRLEDAVELLAVDRSVAVHVELAETRAHHRLPARTHAPDWRSARERDSQWK